MEPSEQKEIRNAFIPIYFNQSADSNSPSRGG
jgi:hypothetical protein